jgi:hypothetical protein
MGSTPLRLATLTEAMAFAAFAAWFIWRLQFTHPGAWFVFPVWLTASFLAHHDTPKRLGWRADNLWPATCRAAALFAVFLAAVCLAGLFLGALHRLPEHFLAPRRLWNYFAFCLLQQVALQSFLTNRLLAALPNPLAASLLAGTIFAALHWPNPVLVPLTLAGGTAMCWLFSRERNIIPLAAGQALLGSLVWWAFPLAWHHAMRVGPGYYSFPY